jgi:hypothetical protein
MSKKIYIFLIILVLTVILITSFYFFQTRPVFTQREQFKYDQNDYSILLKNYVNYRNQYTFAMTPQYYGISDSLFNMKNSEASGIISEFKDLKTEFSFSEKDYQALDFEDFPIIFFSNNNLSWSDLKYDVVCKNISSTNHKNRNELNIFISNELDYPFTQEELSFETRGGMKNRNGLNIYNDLFNLKYENGKVLNLGTRVLNYNEGVGPHKVEECVTNITSNPLNLVLERSITSLNYMTFERFLRNIKGQRNSMYVFGYIGNSPGDSISLSSYGIKSDMQVTYDKLSLEYLYINETSTLIPLIRLDGYAEGEYGKVKITFWNWFIELENLADTD